MKLFAQLRSGAFITAIILAASGVQADTLADDCEALGGEVNGSGECTVTTVTETPFSEIIRDAGKSGLGWTSVGVVVETTIETYEAVTSIEETEVFVEGDPTLPGCTSSTNTPKKCSDHYDTKEVEVSVWELSDSETSSDTVVTGCLNPGGRNMGMHKHCAI